MLIETIRTPFSRRGTCKDENKLTDVWWTVLVSIAAFNIAILMWTHSVSHEMDLYQRTQLILSGVYCLVCAYRSLLPRIDLERYCLFDTQLSSIFLGRSAATVAEISFSAQFALLLFQLGDKYDQPLTKIFSFAIVPSISLAQMFCWYGMLSLNHVGHAIEESIWAVVSAVVAICFAAFPTYNSMETNPQVFYLTTIGTWLLVCYFIFMVTVDVPMYVARWREGRQNGTTRMSLKEGKKDAWSRRVVTSDWQIWKREVPWLTAYFSMAVWTSLTLVHIPIM